MAINMNADEARLYERFASVRQIIAASIDVGPMASKEVVSHMFTRKLEWDEPDGVVKGFGSTSYTVDQLVRMLCATAKHHNVDGHREEYTPVLNAGGKWDGSVTLYFDFRTANDRRSFSEKVRNFQRGQ